LVVLPGASGVAGSRLLSVRDVDDIAECSFSGSGKRLGLDCKTLSSTARSELTQSTLSKNQNTLVLDTSSGVLLCGNHSGELSCTTSIRYRNALAWSTRGGRQFSSSTAVLTANGQLLTCSLEFSSPSLSCKGISGMPAQMQQATYFWTKSGGFIAGLMQGKVFSCSYLAAEHRVATDSCAALVDISAPAKGTQFGVAQRGSGSADELPLIFSSAMNSDANSLQQKDGIGAINAALKAKFLRKPIRHSNPAQPMYSWLVEPIQVAAAQNQFFSDAVLNEPLTIALLSPDEDEPLRMEAFYDTHSSYQLSWEFQSFWEREIRDFWYQLNQRDRPPKEVCIANCRQNYDEFLQFCGFAAAVGTLAGATTGAGVGAVCVAGAYINYLHCQDTNCRTYPG
jgi:hypothetical protein